jgi:flagellar biosynthesis/type III secretory pathway M-ring protein FliF/YscJ
MATEWIYGLIFTAYVACFIFIASYMMIRKKRNENNIPRQANQKTRAIEYPPPPNPCQKEETETSEEAENSEKENLETKKSK